MLTCRYDSDDDHYVLPDEATITTRVRARVCIVLPVRNAQRHIAFTIESILNQTFSDLELVICDNASTDATGQICLDVARRDRRVSYTVLPQAISPHDHLQQAYRLSAGSQYFKWTFPGELLPTTFIQHCVRALDQQPTAVLAFAPAGSITQQQPPQDRDRAAISVNSHSPEQRFAAVALADHGPLCPSELCGLYRRAALELIPPPASHPAAERVFLARLALVGRFVQVPEVLLPRHHHVPSVVPPRLEYSTQIDFPEWRLMLEYLRSIQYGWLNLHQRAACAAIVLHRQVIDGNWVRLGRDVALAGQKLLSRLIRKPGPDLAATTATSAAIAPPVLSSTLPAAARSVPKAA